MAVTLFERVNLGDSLRKQTLGLRQWHGFCSERATAQMVYLCRSSCIVGRLFGGSVMYVWVMMYVVVGGDDDPKGQGKGILQHDTGLARARGRWNRALASPKCGPLSVQRLLL
jgi:hypothetical protein